MAGIGREFVILSLIMRILSFLQELLAMVTEYQSGTVSRTPKPLTLPAFAAWLAARVVPAPADAPPPNGRRERHAYETDESEIGTLLALLYRYAKMYARLALANSPLVTLDDFSYLATLHPRAPLTKAELIAHNAHEPTTGTQIIKRLLDRGLVREQPSDTDRRSKLLHVTEAGLLLLYPMYERMEQVAHLLTGDLSKAEQHQLLHLLHKLDTFHHPIFSGPRAQSLEELARSHRVPPVV